MDTEAINQHADRTVARFIMRLKAFDRRLNRTRGVNKSYLSIEYEDLVLDYLGMPETYPPMQDGFAQRDDLPENAFYRSNMFNDLGDNPTEDEILSLFAELRTVAADAIARGVPPLDAEAVRYESFNWGNPSPSYSHFQWAVAAGAELHDGMTDREVRDASFEAKSSKPR